LADPTFMLTMPFEALQHTVYSTTAHRFVSSRVAHTPR
jgi:hypothetical protein